MGQTIQFHGTADRYTLAGASPSAARDALLERHDGDDEPRGHAPPVGAKGGEAAAFTFDLARSIVYTRQGNPAWAGEERDGVAPLRSDDLFYGARAATSSPTGSISPRSRSRRPTSSSGCSRT